MKFQSKAVLVTGGATGIGLAAAELFLKEGASVVIAGRRAIEGEQALAQLRILSENVHFVRADISQLPDVQQLVQATVERFGRLDIAFNNAGTEGKFGTLEELEVGDLDAVINVNLRGTWLCCKYEVAQMKKQGTGGAIVNTSSWLAKGAFPTSRAYSASKAGLDGMIQAIAAEVAPLGIRVNNVNPGYVVTPMFRRFFDPESEAAAAFKKHAPVGRFAQPAEVAELVVWLASERASFITGQAISVDGGLTIPGPR